MRDDFELQIVYQNGFCEYMRDHEIQYNSVTLISTIHGDQQIYCVFLYYNEKQGRQEWGVYGGVDETADNVMPVIYAFQIFEGNRQKVIEAVRAELYEDYDIPVKELM